MQDQDRSYLRRLPVVLMVFLLLATAFSGCLDDDGSDKKKGSSDREPPTVEITYPDEGDHVSGTVDITVEAEDDEGEIDSFIFYIGDEKVRDGSRDSHRWDTEEFENGPHTITVFALDDSGNKGEDSITVEVENIYNVGPQASIDIPEEGDVFQPWNKIEFDASSSYDPDGDDLTYEWRSDRDGLIYVGSDPDFSRKLKEGAHEIELTVMDPDAEDNTTYVNIRVNGMPEAKFSSPDDIIYGSTEEISFDGSQSSDPDGDDIDYVWTDAGKVISKKKSFKKVLAPGDHDIALKVIDEHGGMDNTSISLHVNHPPKVVFSNTNGSRTPISKPARIRLKDSSDEDGNIISFTIYVDPRGTNTTFNKNTVDVDVDPGYNKITVVATDDFGETGSAWIELYGNTKPYALIGEPKGTGDYRPGDTIKLDASGSTDDDDDEMMYRWVSDIDGEIYNGSDDEVYEELSFGIHMLTLFVTDEWGDSSKDHVVVVVDTPPVAVIAGPEDGEKIVHGETVELNASGSYDEDEDDSIVFKWYLDNLQAENLMSTEKVAEAELPPGHHEIILLVRDQLGKEDIETVSVHVNRLPVPVISSPVPSQVFLVWDDVHFNGTLSYDPDGDDFDATWYLNDLETEIGTTLNFTRDVEAGQHTVYLVIEDEWGDEAMSEIEFVVDTPPVAVIDAPEMDARFDDTNEITLDARSSWDEDGDNLTFSWISSIDGLLYYGSDNMTSVNLSYGEHNIWLTVWDDWGQPDTEWSNISVNGDPVAVISAPENGGEYLTTDKVQFNSSASSDINGDDLSYLWSSDIDGELFNGTDTDFKRNLTEGEHLITLLVTDGRGGEDEATVNITVNYTENFRPDVEITSPDEGSIAGSDINVTGTSSDVDGNVTTVEVRWDEGNWTTVNDHTGDWSEWWIEIDTSVYDGELPIEARAMDDNDTYSIPWQLNVTVDNTPPEVDITAPDDGATVKGIVEIAADVNDSASDIAYIDFMINGSSVQNSTASTYEWDTNNSEYPDGEYLIEVVAEDDIGNVGSNNISVHVRNREPMIINITEPLNNTYVANDVMVLVEITNETGDIEFISFKIDGDEVQNSTSEEYDWDTTEFDDGTYEVEVYAEDEGTKAGDGSSDMIVVNVDNTPPEVVILFPEDGDYISGEIDVHTEVSDASPVLYKRFYINSNMVQNSTSSKYKWDTTVRPDGDYEVKVETEDAAGNENSTTINVTVDNTQPSVSITSPEDGTTVYEDEITIEASASDDNGIEKVEFYFDGNLVDEITETPYEVDVDLAGYSDGDYDIIVIGRDVAGNYRHDTVTITISGSGETPIIEEPDSYTITPYAVAGKSRLVLDEDLYEGVPLSSSLLKNHDVATSVEWSKDAAEELRIDEDDASLFSCRLALSYWDDPGKVIIVDSYDSALMAVPLATMLDLPMILFGEKTNETLWRLDAVFADQLIVVGDTPYNGFTGVTKVDKDNILSTVASTANVEGIELDYVVVAFPGDDDNMALDHNDNSDNYVSHMSAMAGQFAAYRNAVVLTCEGSSVDARRAYLNQTLRLWVRTLDNDAHNIDYMLMVGDYYSLPMIKKKYTIVTANSGNQTKWIPSDNYYLNKYGSEYQPEIAGGRIVAKTLSNMSYYLDRIINYDDYLDSPTEPANPEWTIYDPVYPNYKPWANNALIYQGNAAEFAADSENAVRNMLHDDGHYHTLDDSTLAKSCTNSGDARAVLMDDFANSNFIAINADHGEPHQATLTFAHDDIVDMYPATLFAVSCMMGQIDDTNNLPPEDDSESYDVDLDTSLTYTFFEKGLNVFMAATRTALGSFGTSTITGMVDYVPYMAPGLCYIFFDKVINDGTTTGEAMMEAKADLYSLNQDEGNKYTIWEYTHYGDPAFDPYVPVLDG